LPTPGAAPSITRSRPRPIRSVSCIEGGGRGGSAVP
jgi:hypothetical protein